MQTSQHIDFLHAFWLFENSGKVKHYFLSAHTKSAPLVKRLIFGQPWIKTTFDPLVFIDVWTLAFNLKLGNNELPGWVEISRRAKIKFPGIYFTTGPNKYFYKNYMSRLMTFDSFPSFTAKILLWFGKIIILWLDLNLSKMRIIQ